MNLETVSAKAADALRAFIAEKSGEIQQAIISASELAAENDEPCKFRFGFSICLDVDKGHQEHVLSWAVRHKVSNKVEIEDPLQMKLENVIAN